MLIPFSVYFALACFLAKIRVGFLVVISTYANLFLLLSFLDIFVKVTFLSNDKILPDADVAFINCNATWLSHALANQSQEALGLLGRTKLKLLV